MNQTVNYLTIYYRKKRERRRSQKKGQPTLFSLCIIAYRLATCPTSLLIVNNKLRARSASENWVSVKKEKIQHINIRNTVFLLASCPRSRKNLTATQTNPMCYRKYSVQQKCLQAEFFAMHSTIKIGTAFLNIYFPVINLMTNPL